MSITFWAGVEHVQMDLFSSSLCSLIHPSLIACRVVGWLKWGVGECYLGSSLGDVGGYARGSRYGVDHCPLVAVCLGEVAQRYRAGLAKVISS